MRRIRSLRSSVPALIATAVCLGALVLLAVAEPADALILLFPPKFATTNFAVQLYPSSVGVGDFNGDGKQDLAVADQGSGNVSVLLGNGRGSFGAATSFGAHTSPRTVAVGDFNRDGKQDLAIANSGSGDVSVLLGTGS